MSLPKRYIDDILINWGDLLFYNALRRAKVPSSHRMSRSSGALRLRAQIVRTIRKAPEVMLKITNKREGRNGMQAIRAHLLYVSRNGQIELEDQDGQVMHGCDDVADLIREWSRAGIGIPEESHKREALNLMLSMPPGTDRLAVRDAVRAFAITEFGENFSYVFAAHEDEAHPHVHLCVQTHGRNGKRLNPRKADLQHWREGFAGHLREHGVDANATPRHTRGVTHRNDLQAVVHMRERGALVRSSPPVSGLQTPQAMIDAHRPVLEAWWAIGRALAASDDGRDRQMAVDITAFTSGMPMMECAREHGRDSKSASPIPEQESGIGAGNVDTPTASPDNPDIEYQR